jgi:glycosyltransferase involved in cell wall biosynthesis
VAAFHSTTNELVLKERTKICHLSTVHLPFDTRVFHRECISLSKEYEVYLVGNYCKDKIESGINLRGIKPYSSRLKRILINIPKVMWKGVTINARLYHIHDPELIPVGILLRMMGKKVIYDIHENYSQVIKLKNWVPFPALAISAYKIVEWMGLKVFSGIILSEDSYKKFYPKTDTVTIHNFAFIDQLRKFRVENRHQMPAHLFYMGSLDELYCIMEMLEAISILTRKGIAIKCTMLGSMSKDIRGKLENSAVYKEVKHLIEFLPYMKSEEGYAKSLTATIGLCLVNKNANSYESYPRKMFEYMSIGLPFITSDFPLYKNVAEKHQCGVCVNPSSPSEIAADLEKMINDPAKRELMSKNAIKAAEEHFDWKHEELKLHELYNTLLTR